MEIRKVTLKGLVLGVWAYRGYASEQFWKKVSEVAREDRIDLTASVDFEEEGRRALEKAKENRYQFYMIDGQADHEYMRGLYFSRSVRELQPDAYLLGLTLVSVNPDVRDWQGFNHVISTYSLFPADIEAARKIYAILKDDAKLIPR